MTTMRPQAAPARRRPLEVARTTGFTLIELVVVMTIGVILSTIALVSVANALRSSRGDTAMAQVAGLMRTGREASIGQRRTIDVVFNPPNNIQLVRNEVPNGTSVIAQATLEGGVVMTLENGVPDTPDAYGSAGAVDFDNANTVRFQPDGMVTDAAGVPINGTIFLGRPGEMTAYRAVTLTGSSARAQPYRWTGSRWEAR